MVDARGYTITGSSPEVSRHTEHNGANTGSNPVYLTSSFEHINIINFKRCKVMKHEENVDVRRVSRIAKIDTHNKLIQLNKSDQIGIKTWGRIDYLCNILGYRLIKSGIVVSDSFSDGEAKAHNREVKKQIKADKANNNMKKNNKKKK